MGRRERREQERKEKNKKRPPIQKASGADIHIQHDPHSLEIPKKEPKLSFIFDWIDIAFQLFFIFQLFSLWIAPHPETAGNLLDTVEVLLLLEFSMIPFKLFVISVGRKYGIMIAFFYYGILSLIIISTMNDASYSIIFILMLLNRMCAICLGKMDKKKVFYIAMSVGILIIVLPLQSVFWFFQPSFGLTEKFLNSISYQTEIMDAKFQVLFLIDYYVANIALIFIMRRINWKKEIVVDFKFGRKKEKEITPFQE